MSSRNSLFLTLALSALLVAGCSTSNSGSSTGSGSNTGTAGGTGTTSPLSQNGDNTDPHNMSAASGASSGMSTGTDYSSYSGDRRGVGSASTPETGAATGNDVSVSGSNGSIRPNQSAGRTARGHSQRHLKKRPQQPGTGSADGTSVQSSDSRK